MPQPPRSIKTCGFPELGVPCGGPKNQDSSILGTILGSSCFGELPHPNIPSCTGMAAGVFAHMFAAGESEPLVARPAWGLGDTS